MKTLQTLIKLHKRRVDVLRREMIAFEEERRQLLLLAQKLRQEHADEMQLASREPKIGGFFGAYSARVKQKQASISEEVKRLDDAIEAKTKAIQEEFSEQKKYEIAQANARKRLAEEVQHRLQQRFDEIASQQYLSKTKESPI